MTEHFLKIYRISCVAILLSLSSKKTFFVLWFLFWLTSSLRMCLFSQIYVFSDFPWIYWLPTPFHLSCRKYFIWLRFSELQWAFGRGSIWSILEKSSCPLLLPFGTVFCLRWFGPVGSQYCFSCHSPMLCFSTYHQMWHNEISKGCRSLFSFSIL